MPFHERKRQYEGRSGRNNNQKFVITRSPDRARGKRPLRPSTDLFVFDPIRDQWFCCRFHFHQNLEACPVFFVCHFVFERNYRIELNSQGITFFYKYFGRPFRIFMKILDC